MIRNPKLEILIKHQTPNVAKAFLAFLNLPFDSGF